MTTTMTYVRYSLLILALTSLVQCAGKSDVADVHTNINPDNPVVFNADLSIEDSFSGATVKIIKPWFSFNFGLQNSSSNAFTIIAINIKVTSFKNGAETVKESAVVASNLINDARNTNGQTYLFEVAAGASYTDPAMIYVNGLDNDADSFVFDVEVEFVGWFGDHDSPDKRFSKTAYFSTN